jgi:hypothetical protein
MAKHTVPSEIHVDDGPVTIYVGAETRSSGDSGCLLLILVIILLILVYSLSTPEGAPLGELMAHLLFL